MRHTFAFVIALVVSAGAWTSGSQDATDITRQIDKIFEWWGPSTPGCAVGVSIGGRTILTRAYGLANLEHNIPNTPETIFEAGSVSKQFTAAAVLLLARDGKLSLDDPVRKYLPELPDYGAPLTIRHMLNHTSGIRDWSAVVAIGGWAGGTRAYTQEYVLDVLSRQRSLNFTPGTKWSYSNSGYTLAATIVSRASGMSFADFTRRRIFEPLGMTRTSWRDDYTRIVKDRALAYSEPDEGGYKLEMPFRGTYGAEGLLTTVGDLLKWNQNFASPVVGDAAFVREEVQPGRFSDGRAHHYAFGLSVGSYKGVPEINHSGRTQGYRAALVRYPDQDLSIAELCNVRGAEPIEEARAVADLYVRPTGRAPQPAAPRYTLPDADYATALGLYRNTVTGVPLTIVRDNRALRLIPGAPFLPISASEFQSVNSGDRWQMDGGDRGHITDQYGSVTTYEKVAAASPSTAELRAYVGTYASDEADATMTAAVESGALVLKRRSTANVTLIPVYADAFNSDGLGTVIFRRDAAGRVNALSVSVDRVWDLRFSRMTP